MRYTIYDPVRDCDITTPRGMRITDGPELVELTQEWPSDAIFFRVEDMELDTIRYCTPTEARVLTGCSVTYLYKKTVERKRNNRLFDDRYLIEPVPKSLFIGKSGRKKRTISYYKYSY